MKNDIGFGDVWAAVGFAIRMTTFFIIGFVAALVTWAVIL